MNHVAPVLISDRRIAVAVTRPAVATAAPVSSAGPARGPIGLIMSGTALLALLAALVLDFGVLGGSHEHVILGSAFLAFAGGWALLALLSDRWTSQPQRWAIVPAGFAGVTGAGLLAVGPTSPMLDALGWIWPVALGALVVWMVIQSRRSLRTRRWVLYPVFGVLALTGLAGGLETILETVDSAAIPAHGQMIDVGGHKLHIECTGSGAPTVVLESGSGQPGADMAGFIAPAVARGTRVCTYDRAGLGLSEQAPGTHDGIATASELNLLLQGAHVPGPYVLAGHSTGGVYVRVFAALYPDKVAGMVLLDSQPNDPFAQLPGYPSFYPLWRRVTGLGPSLARVGLLRLTSVTAVPDFPAQARAEDRAILATASHVNGSRDEWSGIPDALAQARALTTLGNKPLIVVTAPKDAQEGWLAAQDQLATLSTTSIHRVVSGADHGSLIEDPRFSLASIKAIQDVVASVRGR